MKVLIGGGGGFIGQRLARYLLDQGLEVVILDRNVPRIESPHLKWFTIDLLKPELFNKSWFEGVDAVINLSGKDIFTLWTKKNKNAIWGSRVTVNKNLIDFISTLEEKPKVFVSASAVGYYGDKGDTELDESAPNGLGFLAEVCIAWEKEARRAESLGMRSVQVRTAPVLDKKGGILGELMKSFKFGFSFLFGSGLNWFSWIHMDDLIRIYHTAAMDGRLSGPVNASSPHAVRYRDFIYLLREFRKALIIPLPVWVLKLLLQETADVLTFSQRMMPAKILKHGFKFSYNDLRDALGEIFSKKV
ncbi:MAG: TIGR01777 family protein [Nitrospirae bacterium]|jgi:uncharacterized protein|nr:TIGR01777 family protein [Nitrospirota bacterium]